MKNILLGGLMFALSATATISHAFSPSDRAELHTEIRSFLLENPQVIAEALSALQLQQADANAEADKAVVEANQAALFNDENSYVGGNPDGDLTLVEFFDYRCSHCRKAHEEIKTFIERDGNIRLILKELPTLGEASAISARFAIAVKQLHGDEAYQDIHEILMNVDSVQTESSLRNLSSIFELPADELIEHMDSDAVTAVIKANGELANNLLLQRTPSFVFDGHILRSYVDPSEFAEAAAFFRSQKQAQQ